MKKNMAESELYHSPNPNPKGGGYESAIAPFSFRLKGYQWSCLKNLCQNLKLKGPNLQPKKMQGFVVHNRQNLHRLLTLWVVEVKHQFHLSNLLLGLHHGVCRILQVLNLSKYQTVIEKLFPNQSVNSNYFFWMLMDWILVHQKHLLMTTDHRSHSKFIFWFCSHFVFPCLEL